MDTKEKKNAKQRKKRNACKGISIDRGSVKNLSRRSQPRWIENLSARHKVSQWIEKLSRQIPESLMDRNNANFCLEKKKEGLDRSEFVKDLLRSRQA